MKRARRLATAGLALFFVWVSVLVAAPTGSARTITLQAPVWAVILLGAYLAAWLVHGVLKFQSYPSALQELRTQRPPHSSV
ncbi:hypothetical protein TSOC_013325 [Tetrabaena socialis]|uniref:Dolichol-phosphate mannosyltransferase subunit 3 n=1 Tax=Tetrabaena socialis TaxID=47790 RepID=A0A2J7ZKP0_9CHLO|nr:hypothetical protein TSOC_013325 [Tetrabaena socialis]|eukprot:PNH00833.1 hypothetical protein TSOC_013325 [Tetrabaena socialis]